MFPREHGAYGQISFPLLTAFAAAGVSGAGLLIAVAAGAAFLAHEPGAILLGQRGARAKRDQGKVAAGWLEACGVIGLIAGATALLAMPAAVRWSIAVPIVPALYLTRAFVAGREKSWGGEVAAALAFAGTAVPVCLTAGASLTTAAAVAVPFALLFISSTLAVRVVILRVRGGGDPRAAAATRLAAFILGGAAAAGLALAESAGVLPAGILLAAAPGLITASAVAARPPSPARLRTLGWTLVAVSVVTAVITAVAAS